MSLLVPDYLFNLSKVYPLPEESDEFKFEKCIWSKWQINANLTL